MLGWIGDGARGGSGWVFGVVWCGGNWVPLSPANHNPHTSVPPTVPFPYEPHTLVHPGTWHSNNLPYTSSTSTTRSTPSPVRPYLGKGRETRYRSLISPLLHLPHPLLHSRSSPPQEKANESSTHSQPVSRNLSRRLGACVVLCCCCCVRERVNCVCYPRLSLPTRRHTFLQSLKDQTSFDLSSSAVDPVRRRFHQQFQLLSQLPPSIDTSNRPSVPTKLANQRNDPASLTLTTTSKTHTNPHNGSLPQHTHLLRAPPHRRPRRPPRHPRPKRPIPRDPQPDLLSTLSHHATHPLDPEREAAAAHPQDAHACLHGVWSRARAGAVGEGARAGAGQDWTYEGGCGAVLAAGDFGE